MKNIDKYISEKKSEIVRTEVEWANDICVDYTNIKLKQHKAYTAKKLDSYLKKAKAPDHITLNWDYEVDKMIPAHAAARIMVMVRKNDLEKMHEAFKFVKDNYNISYFDEFENKTDSEFVSFLFDNSK